MNDEDRIAALKIWRGDVDIAPLTGGLSNRSYKVRDGAEAFVARIGADYPFHHVSRAHEAMVARAAHEAGFAPEVAHSEPGLMVSRFVDGATLTDEDVRARLPDIARLLRRFHDGMAAAVRGEARIFWVFHVIRDYARQLDEGASRMAGRLPHWLALAEKLEEAQPAMAIRFGHHDLLPANFIDDGDRLWLIDFEYAGFGTAMFDLAGATSNAGCDGDQTAAFVEAYQGAPAGPDFMRGLAAMQCASLLREAMWSMVSELRLTTPGVDFEAYTAENLTALEAALARYEAAYGAL